MAKRHSITAHMMASHNPLVVDNAHADPSFRGHPWVVGLPHMRCFAAAPIINEAGYVLGSVTVLDTQPSSISSVVSSKLQAAAKGVVAALNPDSPLFQMQSQRSQARSAMYKLAQNMAESDEVLTTFSNSSSQRAIMITLA
ncbi:hypothetical protein LEN26_012645 [Aphanomyces euteiches]|nr:hypothetical protein AeMF1_008940 [Aphanomyces euteiches]KAH9117505.1 hypothetical protein LEN26_012645 [Aphanomyces euteiches]KAH9190559.1 hypothetical protein AeNC1_007463 [Aphanomyces euteiches]